MKIKARAAFVAGTVLWLAALAIMSGCDTSDDNPQNPFAQREAEWSATMASLKAGTGLPGAPEYHGGPVPHKMNAVYLDSAVPTNWFAAYHSVEDMQIALFYDVTSTDTGQSRTYYFAGDGVVVHLKHVSYSFQLREARSGELLGTLVLEGDRRFNSTYEVSFPPPAETTEPDDVDFSRLTDWLRPFVE